MSTPVVDLDDPFAVPDADFDVPLARTAPTHFADLSKIAEENPELAGGLDLEEEFVPPVPASVQTPPPEDTDVPEVIDVEGGTVTVTKVKNGYEAVLEQEDGGGKEVFKGRTKSELMTNVLAGKLKATQQIRKLNKKLKVGNVVDAPPAPPVPQRVKPKSLTADDIFEIKNLQASDPDAANELWFQKKFGRSASELVEQIDATKEDARRGREAHEELTIESVSKEFLERNKDTYYPYEENGKNVMGWLCKNKLRRAVTSSDNFSTITSELLAKGLYTVENLEEAIEDLQDSGLLIPPPQEEQPETIVEPVAPAPPAPPVPAQPAEPQNPRIVAQRRQPRGGLGIRPSIVSTHAPTVLEAPSVDDLENLSTEQVNELFASVRRQALQNPNRR